MRKRFPKLFKSPYTKDNYNVVCTGETRTIDSTSAFLDEAIGSKGRKNVLVIAGEAEEEVVKVMTKVNYFRRKVPHRSVCLSAGLQKCGVRRKK